MEPNSLVEGITERVLTGQEVVKDVEKILVTKIIVYGKTLKQWAKELFVDTKVNSLEDDHEYLKRLSNCSAQIGKNIQIAEHILGIFEMQTSAANNFKEKEFARKYVEELNNTDGKKIAAEKIRYLVIADNDIDRNEMASQSAALIRDFFKRVVKGLEEARKSIENQITLNKQRIWLSQKG